MEGGRNRHLRRRAVSDDRDDEGKCRLLAPSSKVWEDSEEAERLSSRETIDVKLRLLRQPKGIFADCYPVSGLPVHSQRMTIASMDNSDAWRGSFPERVLLGVLTAGYFAADAVSAYRLLQSRG